MVSLLGIRNFLSCSGGRSPNWSEQLISVFWGKDRLCLDIGGFFFFLRIWMPSYHDETVDSYVTTYETLTLGSWHITSRCMEIWDNTLRRNISTILNSGNSVRACISTERDNCIPGALLIRVLTLLRCSMRMSHPGVSGRRVGSGRF